MLFQTFMLAALGATAALSPATGPSVGDGGVTPFYVWEGALPKQPGEMLRQEPLPEDHRQPAAAQSLRILYSSTDGVGNHARTVVSGALYLPKGAMPAGGWPIVAWAHGTTGIADVCAPSWRGNTERDREYLDAWLSQGFAVVATDYQGLGTPGVHPYLLWRPEGYSVLDSVRAALHRYPQQLNNRVVLVGQSQGSGAALGATYLAPTYAREIKVLGTVATGLVVTFRPAGTLKLTAKPAEYSDPKLMDPAFAMLRIAGTDRSLHPELDPAGFVTDKGRELLQAAQTSCLHDLFKLSARDHLTGAQVFVSDLKPLDADMEDHFVFPDAKMPTPVFVGTGLADAAAGTTQQYNAVVNLCAAGTVVEWHTYPGLSHNGAVNASLKDSLPFVRGVLAGRGVVGTCAHVAPVGPPEKPVAGVRFND